MTPVDSVRPGTPGQNESDAGRQPQPAATAPTTLCTGSAMGLILQTRALEAMVALFAALWCGLVAWKSIDYIRITRRQRAEDEAGSTTDNEP